MLSLTVAMMVCLCLCVYARGTREKGKNKEFFLSEVFSRNNFFFFGVIFFPTFYDRKQTVYHYKIILTI